MRNFGRRFLMVAVVWALASVTVVWLVRHDALTLRDIETAPIDPIELPSVSSAPVSSPLPSLADSTPAPEPTSTQKSRWPTDLSQNSFVGTLDLIIPVVGVRADQLLDTFDDARSEGRVHDAIDIAAPAGTPVVAAAEGRILKLFQSERGGTTIYQLSSDRKLVFYYAHLQQYAPGLAEGMSVQQGDVVAYVGDTGNAGAGNYHLHFSISIVSNPTRYWEGTSINPYPLLRR